MLEAAVEAIRAIDVDGLTRGQLEAFLAESTTLDAVNARARLAAVAALDALPDDGPDAATVLRSGGKVSERAARRTVRTANTLEQMPCLGEQLAQGTITEEHADAAVAAAERVGDPGRADAALARATGVPADLFATEARTWADRNESADRVEARWRRQRRNRKVVFGRSDTDGSFSLYATTDGAEGKELRGLIDAEADRLYREDGGRDGAAAAERTDQQRALDALAGLIRRGAGDADEGARSRASTGTHPRYRAIVTIPLERYLGDTAVPGLLVGGGPLPESVLERILCDAEVSPLIVDRHGRPLWFGRSRRDVSSEQWVALVVRDQGCVVCGADPSRCEAHHIVHWRRNGPTDIDNLVLLCRAHHHDLHDRGLTLTRHDGSWLLVPRAGPRRARAA